MDKIDIPTQLFLCVVFAMIFMMFILALSTFHIDSWSDFFKLFRKKS